VANESTSRAVRASAMANGAVAGLPCASRPDTLSHLAVQNYPGSERRPFA
jgi:hypothetical protein